MPDTRTNDLRILVLNYCFKSLVKDNRGKKLYSVFVYTNFDFINAGLSYFNVIQGKNSVMMTVSIEGLCEPVV